MAKLLGDQRSEKTCNHDRPRCEPPSTHRYEIIIADPRLALIKLRSNAPLATGLGPISRLDPLLGFLSPSLPLT